MNLLSILLFFVLLFSFILLLWTLRHFLSKGVRSWSPGGGEYQNTGILSARQFGSGTRVYVLLHGIVGSSDYFGGAYDILSQTGQVVVPDLLGFGRSMKQTERSFDLEAHITALDTMFHKLELTGKKLVVVGHSMGSLLALHWSARHLREVERVCCFSTPLYRNPEEGRYHIRHMGIMMRLFATEGPLAKRSCELMCKYRTLASYLAPVFTPGYPISISYHGVFHTWASYIEAMNEIILGSDWKASLQQLNDAEIQVLFANGANDPVPVPGLIEELQSNHSYVRSKVHAKATHDLPLTHPEWCIENVLRF